jgi:peptide/nickel transport system substrate-binding protein
MAAAQDDRAREALEIADRKLRRGEISRRDFARLTSMLGIVAVAPTALAACGSKATTGGGAATGGGGGGKDSLRFLVGESFWANWHPYNHTAQIGFKIQRNLFDRLVEVQPDMSLKPGLAESWRQVDARTWEFKLRRGVTFHEGQPLTAEDVKASVQLASGYDGDRDEPLAMAATWGVPHKGEVVDELTVRLIGAEPFGPLLNTLAITDVLSAEDIARGRTTLERRPNGTGAFELADDKPNVKTLERFEDYYRGPAKLRTLTWEFIQDSQTRLNALLAGQADVIDRVEPDQLPLIEKSGGARAISVTAPEIQSMWFRMDKDPFGSNAGLRRAFAWSLDRESMAGLVGGKAATADSHLATGIEFRAPQQPAYVFDPERARAELARAGGPVSFELGSSTGFYPKSKEICELAQQNLEEVGFTCKLTLLELAAWIDMLFGRGRPGEVFYGGWGNLTKDPDFALATLLHSPGAWTGAHDRRTDALIDAGKTETDPAARERTYGRLQEYLWSEYVPAVPILYSDLSNGLRDDVQGYEVYPTFVQEFWPVEISG